MNLSERQRQILALLSQGKSNKEIAFALGIGEGTVKQHLFTLYRKLGATNRAKAVLAAAAQLRAPGEAGTPEDAEPAPPQFIWRLVSSVIVLPQRAPEAAAAARARFEQQMNALQAEAHLLAEALDGLLSVIPGGGLLVCFGIPQNHLDDPARALFLAEHLHHWLRTNTFLQASLGVATATEVVADSAQVLYRGESIDMARALAAHARPMQVLANEITCRLAGPVARYSPPRDAAGLAFSHRELLVHEPVDVQALAARTPLPFVSELLSQLPARQAMWTAVEGWPPQSSVRLQDAIAVALQAQGVRTVRLRLPTNASPARTARCLQLQLRLLTGNGAAEPRPVAAPEAGVELLRALQSLTRQAPLALVCHGINTHAILLRLWGEPGLRQLESSPLIVVTSLLSANQDSHIAACLLGTHPGNGSAPGKIYRLAMPAPALAPQGLHADLATLIDTLRPAARGLIRRVVTQGQVGTAAEPALAQELLTTGLFEQQAGQLRCRDDTVRAALAAFYVEDSP